MIPLQKESRAMDSTQPQKLTNGAQQWFENGIKAMDRQNWKYGVECLGTAVQLQPDNIEFRKQKHRCCRRLFKVTGRVSRLDSVKLAAIRSRLLTSQVRNDWVMIDNLAEEALSIDPWDAQFYAHIGEAAIKADRQMLAKYAYTSAVKIKRDNPVYLRALGGVLQVNGEYKEAKACFAQMQAIDSTGRVAQELIQAVDIASLINQHGYLVARDSRDGVAGREMPSAIVDPTPVNEHQQRLQQFPDSKLVAFVTLAEQHVQDGQLATALEGYRHALEIAPNNSSIRVRMEDVELAFLRGRAMNAQVAVKNNPTCTRRRGMATQLATELTNRELQILSQRVVQNPDDLMQTFRLADLYRRASQLSDAIPLFQKVCECPELQVEAMIGLGECWVRSSHAESGRLQLEEALKLIVATEKPNAFKLAHYWLGRVYEHRGNTAAAIDHYADVIAMDFHFRDAATRLESINRAASQC